MNFHNINLPNFVEIFAIGVSEFSTSCATSMSGREIRSSDQKIPRRKYTLKECKLSVTQFESFNSFFIARCGQRYGFRLKDYCDFSAIKQSINPCHNLRNIFQLSKTYEDNVTPHIRKITKPKISTIKLSINDKEIVPQHIDANLGIVTLNNSLEISQELIASFEFDVPVRFAIDSFQYNLNTNGTISLNNIEIIEVIE